MGQQFFEVFDRREMTRVLHPLTAAGAGDKEQMHHAVGLGRKQNFLGVIDQQSSRSIKVEYLLKAFPEERFLLCQPHLFRADDPIKPWANGGFFQFDREGAGVGVGDQVEFFLRFDAIL